MKRPSFQFYPGDWTSNPNLRRCSHAEKGIWLDVMCILHDQDEYGVLRWPLKEMAQAVGCTVGALRGLAAKSVLKGSDAHLDEPFVYVPRSGRKEGTPVVLLAAQDGPIWYSSRMVKDEYVRTIRGESSRFGAGNDEAPKAPPKATPKAAPKPPFGDGSSSSSSSSSSDSSLRSESLAAREATSAGHACRLMREAGIPRVNPSDPRLLQLLAQGVTPQQLGDLATELYEAGNAPETSTYVLKAMEGRLKAAAAMPQHPNGTAQRAGARQQPSRQDRISATVAELTGRNREPEVIDVVATERPFVR